MKQPTIEEVREYFKDALEVKDNYGDVMNVNDFDSKGILEIHGSYFVDDTSGNDLCLFDCDGYAEITKYKPKTLKNPNAKHYELWDDFEAIDVIKASLTPEEYKGYLKGNVLKYKLRDKGQDESDKVKIKDYQNELKQLNND